MNKLFKPFNFVVVAAVSLLQLTNSQYCFSQTGAGKLIDSILPLDKNVRTGKLPNGFTYYIRNNQEPKNRVVFYLANKVGSILENDNQQGLAHFMEHMNFNGTKHFPKGDLVDYLQKSGVRFGADLNAYTSFDETVYQLPIPSDNPELLVKGIQIMRDWAQEAMLDPVEINKERGVVLEEERLGKGAGDRMERAYLPMELNNSRYANRIPIGKDSVLNNFTHETIRQFYHDWYRPDLQALIVVGDINVDQMEKTIKEKFSDLKNPDSERPRIEYSISLTGKNQFMVVTDKEMTSTILRVLIKNKALKESTIQDYRVSIINQLFNYMAAERIADIIRSPNPPFLSGEISIGSLLGELSQLSVSVQPKKGEIEKGFEAIWQEVARIKQLGFTQGELDRAKTDFLSQMDAAFRERNKVSSESYVEEYLQYFLKGDASPGINYENELVKQQMPGISLTELNQFAVAQLKDTDRDLLVMAPEKDKANLPDEQTMLQWMKNAEAVKLSQYKDDTSNKQLLITQPKGGTLISQSTDTALNITTLELSNHVKIILKPTTFKDNQIVFSAFTPGGTSLYPDTDFQSASYAAHLISSGGAGNYNATELSKYLSGKQMKIQAYMGERTSGVNGFTAPADFENAMQLLYAYYTEPVKDRELFNTLMSRAKAGIANRSSDPGSVFQDSVSAVLSNYNIRRTGPSLHKIDQINLDKSYAVYKQRFGNVTGSTFVFVGSFDIKTIEPLIIKYIGSLNGVGAETPAKDLDIHIPAGHIEKTVNKGKEDKANVLLVWSGKFDYNQVSFFSMNALKECLEIRLLQRLREDESGVYSPSVSVNIAKTPHERFSLLVNFGCAPKNADRLIASTLDEVNKLLKDGPPQINVDKWRAELITSHETEIKTNEWWLTYLNGQLQDNDKLNQLSTYKASIEAVTPKTIQIQARKYLDGKNYIRLVLLPEAVK